jgi:proteic killer suppression protein
MRFRFASTALERLYSTGQHRHKYKPEVVEAFFEVVQIIAAAQDVRDLYALKSLRFEKLAGKRGNQQQRSLRLNDQYRLIVRLERDRNGHTIVIIELCDYH